MMTNSAFFVLENGSSLFIIGSDLPYPGTVELWFKGHFLGISQMIQVSFLFRSPWSWEGLEAGGEGDERG